MVPGGPAPLVNPPHAGAHGLSSGLLCSGAKLDYAAFGAETFPLLVQALVGQVGTQRIPPGPLLMAWSTGGSQGSASEGVLRPPGLSPLPGRRKPGADEQDEAKGP